MTDKSLLSFFPEVAEDEVMQTRPTIKRDSLSDHLDTTMIKLLIDSLRVTAPTIEVDDEVGVLSPNRDALSTPLASIHTASPFHEGTLSFRDALLRKSSPQSARTTSNDPSPTTDAYSLQPNDTTVMLRNVPYEARQLGVLSLVEEAGFKARFSFFYCPLDFRSLNNLGYAFIVFDDSQTAREFFNMFDSKKVKKSGWEKELKVGRARIQHLQPNIEHYRNSPVNLKSEEFKPMLFVNGSRVAFPHPDKKMTSMGSMIQTSGSSVRPRERRLQVANNNLSMKSCQGGARVFVGGLSSETTSESLYEFLGQFGRVLDAQVLFDAGAGHSRTYGFATFSNEIGAEAAIAAGALNLDGRTVVVRKYTGGNTSKPNNFSFETNQTSTFH
jgi:RNA recognition motif-containing protein